MTEPYIRWYIPLRIISEANNTQHWAVKKKRHDAQKKWIKYLFNKEEKKIDLPCKISLTRVGQKELDFDNLCYSFKWIRDQISDCLIPGLAPGQADSDHRIKFIYDQKKGRSKEYALIIEISC